MLQTDDLRLLHERGWVALPGPSERAVQTAVAELADRGVAPDELCIGRSWSYQSTDLHYRDEISSLSSDLVTEWLRDVEIIYASLATTWPGPQSGAGFGGDLVPFPVTPDTLLIELAIDDWDAESGAPWLVPGSHLWSGTSGPCSLTADAAAFLALGHAESVASPAGQILLSDPRLLRLRLMNDSASPRRSVVALARHSALVSQLALPEMPSRQVDTEACERQVLSGQLPQARTAPWRSANDTHVTCERCGWAVPGEDEPHPWLGGSHGRCASCHRPPVIVARRQPDRTRRPASSSAVDPLPLSDRPVLADPVLDRSLRENGFVLLPEPVITPEHALQVRQQYGDLHGWTGRGHLNDFNHRDLGYRERATRLMREELLGHVEPHFVNYKSFLHTFLCKWPHTANDIEPHRDWMYVDERLGERTYIAFIALDDIGDGRGRIRYLPGSHRIDSMIRGTDLRPRWLEKSRAIERRMQAVSMEVGQCAVWTSSLTHASERNDTASPRVGAGLWFAPTGIPLTHFCRLDRDTAGLFEIDEDFYRLQNPYRLMAGHPPYPMKEVVPVQEREFSDRALSRALRRRRRSLLTHLRSH